MSFPTYVDPIPLPAPVTTGSTIQSYTDPLGDLWVAKNGVRSGNWYRAREVLRGRIYRAAALTPPTNWQTIVLDGTVYDPFGIMGVGTTVHLTVPVAGYWEFRAQCNWTASGRAICTLWKNATGAAAGGNEMNRGFDVTPGGTNPPMNGATGCTELLVVGDTVAMQIYNTTSFALSVGAAFTFFQATWVANP